LVTLCYCVRRRPHSTLFPYTTLFRSALFEEELETVGHGLEDSERPRPHRSQPVLEVGHCLALRPHVDEGDQEQQHECHEHPDDEDRKSTRLNSSHVKISYAAFC